MDDDELWRDLERADLAEFIQRTTAGGSTVDLVLPEQLAFTLEQRAFIASLVSHVAQELTYELSHKWAQHMIHILVAGEWQTPEDVEPTGSHETPT